MQRTFDNGGGSSKRVHPISREHDFAEVVAVHADEEILIEDDLSIEKLSLFAYCPVVHGYRALADKTGSYGFSAKSK